MTTKNMFVFKDKKGMFPLYICIDIVREKMYSSSSVHFSK